MARPKPLLLTSVLSLVTLLIYGVWRLVVVAPGDQPLSLVPRTLADELPAFTLPALDGTPVSTTDLAGRPLVINFWATWCAPCLREIPLLKSFQADNPGVTVVGIAVDRAEAVARFAAEMDFNYPVLVGQADAMDAASALGLEVFVLPSTVYVAATGAIIGVHVGEIHDEHLGELAATLTALADDGIGLTAARQQLAGRR